VDAVFFIAPPAPRRGLKLQPCIRNKLQSINDCDFLPEPILYQQITELMASDIKNSKGCKHEP
jgi:hypothetical protein